jgi:hypothetical protein
VNWSWRAGAVALWIGVLGATPARVLAEPRASSSEAAAQDGASPVAAAPSHQVALSFPLPQPWLVAGALPPPPKIVVRTTRMYGTVTIDHAAHLKRRTRCASCHGQGPVSKIMFTPQTAHDRCRGCHVELARGPTECRSCHVVPPPPVPATLAAATPAEKPAGGPASPGAPGAPGAAAPAAAASATPAGAIDVGVDVFSKSANLGLSTMLGDGGSAKIGPSIELVGGTGRNLVAYTIASAGGPSRGRTQLLVSGGRWTNLEPNLRGTLMLVGGVDGTYWNSSIYPVVGVRTGLEYRTRTPVVRRLVFSMAVLRDLARRETAGEERPGELTVTLTVGAGFHLSLK